MILTKEEDNALTSAGLRSAVVPIDEDASPMARYVKVGVQGEFMSLLDDPAGPKPQHTEEALPVEREGLSFCPAAVTRVKTGEHPG